MQRALPCLTLGAALALLSCSDDSGTEAADAWAGRADAASEPLGPAASRGGDDASAPELDAGPEPVLDAAPGLVPDGGTCAVASTEVRLLPVRLAFAFDVSGSMGKGDKAWHDKALKWDPVVRATRGFFEDPASQGLSASLSFFPSDGGEDDRCEADTYGTPAVPMTALPSTVFYAAIQAIEPKSSDDWRGGTPTLFVLQGTRAFLQRQAQAERAKYAMVLVTDGYPQGCDDDTDSVDAVVNEAQAAAREGVPTYVIGVANPPLKDAPDTVSDLGRIAVAGQTTKAYLIATGNESATFSAFREAVTAIREAAAGCEVAIPAPQPGRAFDKRKVSVALEGAATSKALHYDASCADQDAWHYDDPADPKRIALCPATCERVKREPTLRVAVQFGCENVVLF